MGRSNLNCVILAIAVVSLFEGKLHGQNAVPLRKQSEPSTLLADYIQPVQFNVQDRSLLGTPMSEAAKNNNGKQERPRTLLSWNLFKDDEADDKNGDKNGKDKNGGEKKPSPLTSDRPDFTESSATLGLGRVQVEMGWTYTWDRFEGTRRQTHTYPELLVRAGVFAEWFEIRLGQNWRTARTTSEGVVTKLAGADDLYLGGRFMLTEQQKILPEQSITFQMTVPSGGPDVSGKRVLPGFNYTFSWEVNDFFGIGGSLGMNAATDNDGTDRPYSEWFSSVTTNYTLTEKLGAFAEFYAIMPHGARGPDTVAQYYFDTGLQYMLTPDLAFDVRIGVGLNRHSDDFFVGSGLVLRR